MYTQLTIVVYMYTPLSICTQIWLFLSIHTHCCLFDTQLTIVVYTYTLLSICTHSWLLLSLCTHGCLYVLCSWFFFYQLNNHKLYTVVPLLWGTEQHNEGTILVSTQKISNHTTYSLARSKVDGRLIIRFTIFLYG